MGDSLITIVAIVVGTTLMFVFPLMTLSKDVDNTAQLAVQTATTEFVDNIRTTGKITLDEYQRFLDQISSTGNSFEDEILIQQLDENPGAKTTQADSTKIGENLYYNMYDSQVKDKLTKDKKITLKEGDIVTVKVRNTNKTIAQELMGAAFTLSGNDSPEITAQGAGVVAVNGSTSGNK